MSEQEQRWLFEDWQDGKDIEFLCEEYDVSEAVVFDVISQQLGIRKGACDEKT